jgi:LysR family nitrogen assimilation transcriptional regulator
MNSWFEGIAHNVYMEIRQLELLLAVMECGSVTRAAEKVSLSPGAVSMQIHALATELRTELFIRSGRRFLPTPAAIRLTEHAKEVVLRVRQIEQEFEADPTLDLRPFYFSTGATALIYRLGRPLRNLRTTYPNASIQVTVAATEATVQGLLERRFDLGLISLPYSEAGLKIIPLYEEELLILKPSRTPVRGSAVGVINPSELEGVPFLLYPETSNMRPIIDSFFMACNVKPKVVMEADDTEAIKSLVEAGFGYAVIPEYAVKTGQQNFKSFRVPGNRMSRTQALAMPDTEYPRALTLSIARSLQVALGKSR